MKDIHGTSGCDQAKRQWKIWYINVRLSSCQTQAEGKSYISMRFPIDRKFQSKNRLYSDAILRGKEDGRRRFGRGLNDDGQGSQSDGQNKARVLALELAPVKV